jgi:hypothetical protein
MRDNYIIEIQRALRREKLRRLLATLTRIEQTVEIMRREVMRQLASSYRV